MLWQSAMAHCRLRAWRQRGQFLRSSLVLRASSGQPQAGDVSLSVVPRPASRAERAHARHARGRSRSPAPRPHRVRDPRAQGRAVAAARGRAVTTARIVVASTSPRLTACASAREAGAPAARPQRVPLDDAVPGCGTKSVTPSTARGAEIRGRRVDQFADGLVGTATTVTRPMARA